MNMIRTLLLLCALPLFAWQANAQTSVKIYSGESLPTQQGWTEQKLDATVNDLAAPTTLAAESGVLKLTSTNATDQFSQLKWYRSDLGFNPAGGFTLEIKAKITSADKTGAFNIQGFDRWGKGFRIGILGDAVTEQTNPFSATNYLAGGLDNSAFHVYRIVATPDYMAEVFRDGVSLGFFPIQTFQFDNIIENGGFEDDEFPDFLSDGTLRRVSAPKKKLIGEYALEMDNDGLVTNDWIAPEYARTREIAVKPNTPYEIYITRRRTQNEPWCWRDMGAFYDYQLGTMGLKGENVDKRGENITWGGFDRIWQTHPQDFTTTAEAKTVRFEFPTWDRDSGKRQNTTSFENFTFREKPMMSVLPPFAEAEGFQFPIIPEEITNLIANGDFEDETINNDGTPYLWALASENTAPGGETKNTPTAYNAMWNGQMRLQDQNKPDDFDGGNEFYAHSGTHSARFSTLNEDSNGKTRNFDFTVPLEANKTYRFVFWHRNPKWDDFGWLLVRLGEESPIWGHRTGGRANKWIPVDLTFTTTATNNTLHLYTLSVAHGDWFNQYFDDFVLYEIPDGTPLDPQIEGKTNLIANGGFEDVNIDNDGMAYPWALASDYAGSDEDFPLEFSEIWGSWVRIQDKEKRGNDYWGDRDDTGYDWAHSGNNSLRFTFQDNWDNGQAFEGLSGDVYPEAYKLNMDFKKELEPNKTYTFVFWIKTSCWNDRGWFHVANGDMKILSEDLSNKYMNWTRQSVTFSTTIANHTLRMFTEFGGWFNFYLDDLFLFEEDVYVPAAESEGLTYFAFGKSTGTSSADVEVEYITLTADWNTYYDIVYNLNGGEGVDNDTYQIGNALITLPIPGKTGYTFAGWFDNEELDGDAITEIPAESFGNKEFWAKWTLTDYSITYNLNGGTGATNSTYTIESATITLPFNDGITDVLIKTGYTFGGWFDNEELDGDAVTEIEAGSTGNKEFWAKWDVITYNITYELNTQAETAGAVVGFDDGVVVPYTYTIESATIVLPTPIIDLPLYVFKGWFTNSRFTPASLVTEIEAGSNGNKTVWAKWEISDGINANSVSNLKFYPNPVVNGTLTVANIKSVNGQIEIYSIVGTLVKTETVTNSVMTVDVAALSAGTYIVKVDGNIARIVKK